MYFLLHFQNQLLSNNVSLRLDLIVGSIARNAIKNHSFFSMTITTEKLITNLMVCTFLGAALKLKPRFDGRAYKICILMQ